MEYIICTLFIILFFTVVEVVRHDIRIRRVSRISRTKLPRLANQRTRRVRKSIDDDGVACM